MSFNLRIRRIITEAVQTFSSRQRLKQITATPLYKNAFYLMLSTAVTSLFGFFFWIVAARFYSETEVGFGSAIISAINLITLFGLVGLNFSIIRFLSQADRPQELINSAFVLSGLVSLVAAGIFIAGLGFWSPALSFIRQNVIFLLAFLVIAVLSMASELMDSIFVARRRAGFVLCKNAILSFLKIPLLVALVGLFYTFSVVASWGASIGIALVISVLLFLPRVEAGYKPVPALYLSHVKGIRQYAGSNYLASILARAPAMILPLMVVNILGTQSNAYFYIAWMVANLLSAIPQSVSQSLFAEGSHSEENFAENVMKSIKFTFLLLVPAVAVLIVSAKWILLAFGESYSVNGLHLLWLLSFSSLPRAITFIYLSLLRVQDKLKELVIVRGAIAVLVLTLTALIMPSYGIMGVGYVWLAVQLVVSITLVIRLVAWVRQLPSSTKSTRLIVDR